MAPHMLALLLVGGLLHTSAGQDASCPEGVAVPVCAGQHKKPQDFIRAMTLRENGYDKSLRPPCGNATHAGPTVVEVQIYLHTFNSYDIKGGVVNMNAVLRTFWNDPRLRYDTIGEGGCFDMIELRGKESRRLWMPDVFVDNLVKKSSSSHHSDHVTIDPEGNVMKSQQVNLLLNLAADLGAAPYDHHRIEVVVASYSQDISRMRLMPRGGKLEEGESGVGLIAPAMYDPMWSFLLNGDNADTDGFETPGKLETLVWGSHGQPWDFVSLSFQVRRKPKYFIGEVAAPAVFFLVVANLQFYVEPQAAPARAFLGWIPVLMMRLITQTVYFTLPETSQSVWLVDILMVLTVLTCLGMVEFWIVQYMLQQEHTYAAHLASLKALKPTIDKMIKEARAENIKLSVLLDKFKPSTLEVDPVLRSADKIPDENAQEPKELRTLGSEEARRRGLKQWELLIVKHIKSIFEKFDADNSGKLSVGKLCEALEYFNIYMSKEQAAGVICVLLRDDGLVTPEKELDATLTFGRFCILLSAIEKYSFMTRKTNIFGRLHQLPPSKRLDMLARIAYPVMILIIVPAFFLMIPAYDTAS